MYVSTKNCNYKVIFNKTMSSSEANVDIKPLEVIEMILLKTYLTTRKNTDCFDDLLYFEPGGFRPVGLSTVCAWKKDWLTTKT
jgi:hypothetical protein